MSVNHSLSVKKIVSGICDRSQTKSSQRLLVTSVRASSVEWVSKPEKEGSYSVDRYAYSTRSDNDGFSRKTGTGSARPTLEFQYAIPQLQGAGFVRSVLAAQNQDLSWLYEKPLSDVYSWIDENNELFLGVISNALHDLYLDDLFTIESTKAQALFVSSKFLTQMKAEERFGLFNAKIIREFAQSNGIDIDEEDSQKFVASVVDGLARSLGMISGFDGIFYASDTIYIQTDQHGSTISIVSIDKPFPANEQSFSKITNAPHYIRQRHRDKLAHFKMPFMARDESFYRNMLSLFSGSDSWIFASSQEIASELSKRPRFRGELAFAIRSELKSRTGGELDFEDCEKLVGVFVHTYLSQGNFQLTYAISQLVGGSEHLLQRLNVQTEEILSELIQGIDKDIERSVITRMGYQLIDETNLESASEDEFFVVNHDGVISFVTVENHFEPEFEPVDKEIYERDIKQYPDRANLAKFFNKHYGEQEEQKKRNRKGKNNRNHWGESGLFSIRSRSKSHFSDDMWNYALGKEKAASKAPIRKSQVNTDEVRQRDGLYRTQDAITAGVELIGGALNHFNTVGEYLGFNTRPQVCLREPNKPMRSEIKNTAQKFEAGRGDDKLFSTVKKTLKIKDRKAPEFRESRRILDNLACLGVAFSSPAVKLASSVLCFASQVDNAYPTTADLPLNINLSLSFVEELNEESEEFSWFLQYISFSDCDPAWVLFQYAHLTNKANIDQVEALLRANPQVIQRFFSSDVFLIQDPFKQNAQLQFLYELINPDYKESSLPFLYFKNKYEMDNVSALEFLHNVFKLQDIESINQAKSYILENNVFILNLEKEISLTDWATAFVVSRVYKIIKGDMNLIDFFKDTEAALVYNLIHALLEMPDILENKVLKEILLTNSPYIFLYFQSDVYKAQSEDAQKDKMEKLNLIYNENTSNKIVNTFNRDKRLNEEHAIANLIEASIFMFTPKEREQAALYLLNHKHLIDSYKNGAIFQHYSLANQEIISKDINVLLSNADLEQILTPIELAQILTPDLSTKVQPEITAKLLALFPENITQVTNESLAKNKHSDRLYQIELTLYQQIDGLRDYLRSQLHKDLNADLKEKREVIIKNIVKKYNRLFFREGVINMPLASLFEDNEHIEHMREQFQIIQERSVGIEKLTQQLNLLKAQPTSLKINKKISELEEEIKQEQNLADHEFYVAFATTPSIKTFNKQLQEEGKKLTLNHLLMLKNVIIAASQGKVHFDDSTIDEAIELFGLLQKIEPMLLFQYQKIMQGDPIGQYVVSNLEEEYDGITFGAIIQSEVKKSKERTGVKTCDVEEYLIPVVTPTSFVDLLISIAGAVKKYLKSEHYSNIMQIAVRYHFLQEGKNKIHNSSALKSDYLLYVMEKYSQAITGNPLSIEKRMKISAYHALSSLAGDLLTTNLWRSIYDDLIEKREISSLSARQIEAMLLRDTIFRNITGMIPFVSSLEEWYNSIIKIRNGAQGKELFCSIVKSFSAIATELLDYVSFEYILKRIKKITKTTLFQQITKRANAALPAMDANTFNSIKREFLAAGFVGADVTFIFDKLKKLDIANDPEILRAIIAENCDISTAEKIKLSQLSADQYSYLITNFRHYYPDFFKKKFSSLKDQAIAMQSELLNISIQPSVLFVGGLEHFFTILDDKHIPIDKGKVILAEKLKLRHEDKLRFTGLAMSEYKKILTDISKHHFDFLKKNIYSFDGLALERASIFNVLKDKNMLLNETDILSTIDSYYKKYDNKSPFNSIYQPLSLAHFLGQMSEDAFKKIESLRSDTAIATTVNDLISKYALDLGEFNRFSNLLSYDKSAFIALGSGFSFAYLHVDKTTGKKVLYLPRTNEFNLLRLPFNELNQHVRAMPITKQNTGSLSRWFDAKNMRGLLADRLTQMHLDTLIANNYEQLSSAMSVEYKKGVIFIEAKGDKYITHAAKGMLDGKTLAKDILADHASSLDRAKAIDFKSSFSGYGGAYSSAQVLANELRVPVVGYEGDVELCKRIVFHPEPLGAPLLVLAKEVNEKFSRENQNLIAYLRPEFSDFVEKNRASFDLPYDPDQQPSIQRYYNKNLKSTTTEADALAQTGKETEAKHRARNIEYEKYQIACRSKRTVGSRRCAPFPKNNLVDLLNKDYKLHKIDWDLTNDVKSVLRSMLIAEQITGAEFRKAMKLLMGNNRFNDYLQLFKGTATSAIDLNQGITESGIFSFTLQRDPLQVSHTAYIFKPNNGAPSLFTSNRMDLDNALSQVTTGTAAARALAYTFTPQMATKLQEWARTSGYEIKFTSVTDLKEQIGLHPSPDITGYQFDIIQDFNIGFDGNEIFIRTHGAQALSGIPSGLATATNVAKYLKREHQQNLVRANQVHLIMCYGAKGGTWNSQAQVLANKIGKPVIGYTGKINMLAQAAELSMHDEHRHTFYPQSGVRKYLTQALNEIIGDRQRTTLLRSHPEWKEVAIAQAMDVILDRPIDFFRDNKLELGANFNPSRQVYISNIGDNHYQFSNDPSAKSASTRVGFIPVTSLSEAELASFQGMPLSTFSENLLVTPELSTNIVALRKLGQETYVAHIKPVSGKAGIINTVETERMLQALKAQNWQVFWNGSNRSNQQHPTRLFVVKDVAKWLFFKQRVLPSQNQVERIFKSKKYRLRNN